MMRRIILSLILTLFAASAAFSQSTTVGGTVTDAGSQTWNNGTVSFAFVPAPNLNNANYTWTGGAFNPTNLITGTMNGSGVYSVSVPSNTAITPVGSTWLITVCPQGAGTCFQQNSVITGGSQAVNLTPPAIVVSCSPNLAVYADAEVQCGIGGTYYSLTLTSLRVCTAASGNTCSVWAAVGTGGGGTPCTTTALSFQYNNAGAFGCVPDLTFTAPHTIALGASGIFTITGTLNLSGATVTWPGTVVLTNQSNAYSTGAQDFSSVTSLKVPIGASLAPTTAALIGYDTTNNRFVGGNGTNTSFLTWLTAAPVSGNCAQFSGTLGRLADSGSTNCGGLANPMTTLGDVLYGGASGVPTRLAGPTVAGTYSLLSKPSAGAATALTFGLPGVVTNAQVGTTYTYQQTDSVNDRAGFTTFANASAIAVTLPSAASFGSNWTNLSCDQLAGTATITPTTSTIDSYNPTAGTYTAATTTLVLTTGQCAFIYSDNTNYHAVKFTTASAGGQGIPFGAGAGSVNVMTVTTVPAVNVNTTGTVVNVQPNLANTTTTPTLTVGTSGALTIVKQGSSGAVTALVAGDYGTTAQNQYFTFISNGTNWILLNPASGTLGTLTKVDATGNIQCVTNVGCSAGTTNEFSTVQSNVFIAGNSLQGPVFSNASTALATNFTGGQDNGLTGGLNEGGGTFRGGDATGATGANTAGPAMFRAGASTSTFSLMGLVWYAEPYFSSGTNTLYNLQCEGASMSVQDCGASPTTVIGVAANIVVPIEVVTSGTMPVNASAAVTLGHTVCAAATAGKVTDSGGLTACALGTEVGIVMAVSGTYNTPLGGTVVLSTTLPLVHMKVD